MVEWDMVGGGFQKALLLLRKVDARKARKTQNDTIQLVVSELNTFRQVAIESYRVNSTLGPAGGLTGIWLAALGNSAQALFYRTLLSK